MYRHTHMYITYTYIYIAWYSMHVHATSHISGDVSSRNLLVIPLWSLIRRQAALTTLIHGIIKPCTPSRTSCTARYGPNDPWQLDMGHIVLSRGEATGMDCNQQESGIYYNSYKHIIAHIYIYKIQQQVVGMINDRGTLSPYHAYQCSRGDDQQQNHRLNYPLVNKHRPWKSMKITNF